jgi:hypothetical protein
MLDAVGEPIENAIAYDDIAGLAFVQVGPSGKFAIYNLEVHQALKRRFDTREAARQFAIAKLMSRV